MKTVSIIVPVYNVAQYLRQCLDTLTAQTYPALEIILINDGSTDQSGAICDEYALKDSRIRVIHQENAGAANAKNAGLDHAAGDYIAFMDSDDFAEPNWIERLVTAAQQHEADVVECDFDKVYRSRSEVVNQYQENAIYTAEEYLAQYLDNWTCSLFWNKLFRSSLLTDVRFRRERRCIDDEFFTYRAFADVKKVLRITDVLYHYRQRASGAVSSEKNRLQITDDSLEILLERYRWICQRFPSLRKTYLMHDVQIMFYFAKEFAFTNATRKKFRKIARFYLKESILRRSSKVMVFYACRLQTIRLGENAQSAVQDQTTIMKDHFA